MYVRYFGREVHLDGGVGVLVRRERELGLLSRRLHLRQSLQTRLRVTTYTCNYRCTYTNTHIFMHVTMYDPYVLYTSQTYHVH